MCGTERRFSHEKIKQILTDFEKNDPFALQYRLTNVTNWSVCKNKLNGFTYNLKGFTYKMGLLTK